MTPPLRTVSVVEALAGSLRERILNGDLPPDRTLAEAEVCTEYAVSRPTAKSSITLLVQEGLLIREANRPAYVPRLTGADVADLFFVRIPLEEHVVRHLVATGSIPVAAMRQAINDLAEVPDGAPHSTFVEADLRFHVVLARAARSPRLDRVFGSIQGEIHLGMAQTRSALGRDRIIAEHGGVLEAMVAGDVEAAVTRMRSHLQGACEALSSVAGP